MTISQSFDLLPEPHERPVESRLSVERDRARTIVVAIADGLIGFRTLR